MQNQDGYLSINQGETLIKQERIPIGHNDNIILGRVWKDLIPDVPFTSQYVSRKHALIGIEDDHYFIVDLMSKHGTQINNTTIEKNKPVLLQNGDIISLAKGTAVLTFYCYPDSILDATLEFPAAATEHSHDTKGISLNTARREILIDGVQIYLTSKDTGLLWLLYQSNGTAVSYDEIKITVWPERISLQNALPDVGREEINTLVYRLRKKLGKYGQYIISVPRYGYMLDLKE
ncbi:FHA domain-containing protein [Rummeliibacillus stabekisii]|uniref:FHA domain-containing protein n=1 Tax=Rummeliibacillus stabekisii TaxID=241244 RepID=UPI0037153CBD